MCKNTGRGYFGTSRHINHHTAVTLSIANSSNTQWGLKEGVGLGGCPITE